jgi:manganese efflux pump family protein
MLLAGDKDDEERAARIITSRGLALIALGLSISLDELAIGFTIGLAHLPVTTVIASIALQAFIAAQLGPGVGAKIGEHWRERAEQVAGIALVLLGAYLIGGQLAPVSAACKDHCASESAADSNRPADRSPGI